MNSTSGVASSDELPASSLDPVVAAAQMLALPAVTVITSFSSVVQNRSATDVKDVTAAVQAILVDNKMGADDNLEKVVLAIDGGGADEL